MRKIIEYLRLIFFVGGVLVGVQIPNFVDQYGKTLESHFLESQKNLGEFQADANKYFDGNLDKLIEHYGSIQDPIVNDGGKSITAIYKRNITFADALARFTQSIYSPYIQALITPITEIKKEVWKNYTYSINLTTAAILWGLVSGLFLSALIEFTMFLLFHTHKAFNKQSQSTL